ncbi:unnamed protein product (macronuclear) [Paramecium tetraurelia]|uniref:Histidine kinase n=1 Tax=Paramecium tetraurelia TaxID=5888 RepID=A0E3B9_PARTE|nr:uncharacterized protein GSPATT00022959001 [Paramecium tetraurelia]CAK89786.1 unnamed protein product [Paramecium tetraurelia]|eukprot:XP_001457183.1 hypothetical protein (macronuclear) [Paramecium tetraurelia strain d4-2]
MMSNFLFQIALELIFINNETVNQRALQFVLILINVILFQVESIKYGIDNVDSNYSYIIIMYLLNNYQNQEIRKAFWQVIYKFLLLILFLSFYYSKEESKEQRSIDYYCKIVNQKLNMAIVIFLLQEIKGQEQKQNILSTIDEKIMSKYNQNTKKKECVKQDTKRSSFQDLSEILTDRKQTIQKYQLYQQLDQTLLLDILTEAVIIIKFEKSEEPHIYKPRIDYQNQISKAMFQKNNSDLLQFFEKTTSEVLSDDSPVNPRNSLLSFQSFAQQQYKNMKRSSKFNPQQYFVAENKQDQKSAGLHSVSPRLRSLTTQLNTIYKSLLYVYNTKKVRFEINGKVEALIIETNFEIDNTKKTVEMLVTIGGDDLLLVIARDVVHRKNIKELFEINQSKSKILSFVSHEFRSPLNVMINVLQNMMEDKSLKNSLLQPLKIVLENSYYMLNLSNDLLDLAQIKNETFSLNLKTIDIIQLGEECIKMFQLQAEQKNIKLNVITNIKPLYIYTDKSRLKQIIINLLANAMKFTQKGSISIKIKQRGFLVDVGVEDTGIGISQQNQNKLFKAFVKIKDSENQKLNEQGVGLGLVISNKIAQQLSSDGQGLRVISRDTTHLDHGSFFYLILKIKQFHAKITSSKLQQVDIEEIESPFSDKHIKLSQFRMTFNNGQHSFADDQRMIEKANCQHILIVDDNVFNQNILEMQIQQFTKAKIDKNNSGIEAIESVKSKKCNQNCQGYNAIFMDMEMPGLDGFQASTQILQFNGKIKIFIVSGYEKSQFDEESKKIGIQEFIVKPISKDIIQRIILENHL